MVDPTGSGQQALLPIRKAAQSPELSSDAGRGLVDIVSRYTQTFLWLGKFAYRATTGEKPPHNIRLPSKGMAAGSISLRRGSAITAAFTLSRSSREE